MSINNSSSSMSLVGVDLGGTNIRAGKVTNDSIVKIATRLIPKTNKGEDVTAALVETIREVIDCDVAGIGIGVPSMVDFGSGMIYSFQNIPAWRNIRLGSLLESEFGVPVYVNNDANCFATGECFFGDGRNYNDFVGLITGTGLGAGIISQRQLVSGRNCGAGEFGVIPYLDQNLEYYTSSHFFTNKYSMEAEEAARKARKGDSRAIEAYRNYGKHLGVAIKAIMASVDPEAVIIGGGISKAFSLYKDAMWDEVRLFDYQQSVDRIVIQPSSLPEIAILGAAALYLNARVIV